MATTTFDTNNLLTQKLWSKIAFRDSVKETILGKLMGKSDTSIIQIKDDLQKSAGDRIRFRIRALPQGIGVDGDATLEGKEEGLEFASFDLGIDSKRHAHKVDLGMNQQRVDFDLRSEAKDAQSDWWSEYMDRTSIEFLSGSPTLTFHPSGMFAGMTPLAPSANRLVYGGVATSAASLQATDKMTLNVIDKCVEKARLSRPSMRRGNFNGKNCYILLIHPYQTYDLRTNTSTGQWFDIQKAAMTGGKVADNPIFGEALGMYNDVLIVENTRVSTFATGYGAGGNIPAARALFLGAQAACVAFGRGFTGAERMSWKEKTFDYDRKFGVAAEMIWGIQKTRFNMAGDGPNLSGTPNYGNDDFGVISVDTAAAPHS